MKKIQYSDAQYILTIASLNSKIQEIDSSMACPNTGTTNAEVMKKFVTLFEELGSMILEYQELLEQDQKALEKVGLAIKAQDMRITELFR